MNLKLTCLMVVFLAVVAVPGTDAWFRRVFKKVTHFVRKPIVRKIGGFAWNLIKKKYGLDTLVALKEMKENDQNAYMDAMNQLSNELAMDFGEEDASELVSELDEILNKNDGELQEYMDAQALQSMS